MFINDVVEILSFGNYFASQIIKLFILVIQNAEVLKWKSILAFQNWRKITLK